MKVLVLGGTRFVGRHMVEAASRHGHEVSVFNRAGPTLISSTRGSRAWRATATGTPRRWKGEPGTRSWTPPPIRRGWWGLGTIAVGAGGEVRIRIDRVGLPLPGRAGYRRGRPLGDLAAPASRIATSNAPHNSWDHEMAHTNTLEHPFRPGPSK